MPRALWTGASGMAAQQTSIDLIANNIANINTSGFKRQRADFQDLFYDVQRTPGMRNGDTSTNPTGVQIGTGVHLVGTTRLFSAGSIEATGNATDMAIAGEGFFRVVVPDGSFRYTRAGDFRVDSNGDLVTPDGYYLDPRITVPDGATSVAVGDTGEVTALVNNAITSLGTVTLSRFRNPAGLMADGRNLFLATDASGPAQDGNAGSTGFGIIRGGQLEKANVEIVTELVNMIVAQRAYEMNSRSVRTADSMLQTANELIR